MVANTVLSMAAEEQTLAATQWMPVPGCNCPLCAGAAGNSPDASGTAQVWSAQSAALAPSAASSAALFAGSNWATGAKTVITYSFATSAIGYGADADFASTLTQFSAADQSVARAVLATISAVCNVSFVEVADTGAQHGQVRYAFSQSPDAMGYAGYSFFPGTAGAGGDVWIGQNMSAAVWSWYRPDLILHETLHALGLKHPFDGGATLDTTSDIIPNTVMSYSAMAGSKSGWMSDYPTEPMALDVAALQAIYGASTHNAGDTVYDLSAAVYQSNFHTIWDSTGKDTFDASHIGHGVTLDLREGGHSDIGVAVNASASFSGVTRTTTYTDTITVASGTTIEAAIGSAFDDIIAVGAGTKSVDGGAGNDTVLFFGNLSDYRVDQSATGYTVTNLATDASTTLVHVERLQFEDAELQQAAATTATGGAAYEQAFRLYQAALDRTPDQAGLIFQTHALDSGTTLTQLASNFMSSPEFQQRYNVAADKDFVTLLYANVLGRAPEASGLGYYIDHLVHGTSRADVLVGFSESPENQANVAPQLIGVSAEGMLVPVV